MWIKKRGVKLSGSERELAYEGLLDLDLQRNMDRIWRAGNVHMDGLTEKERIYLEKQWNTLRAVQLNINKVKERLKHGV